MIAVVPEASSVSFVVSTAITVVVCVALAVAYRRMRADVTSTRGRTWALVAGLGYCLALGSLWLSWVDGFTVEQAATVADEAKRLGTDVDLGFTTFHLDALELAQLDPGSYVTVTGSALGPISPWVVNLAVMNIVAVIVGSLVCRPLIQVSHTLLSAIATSLAALLLWGVELVNLRRLPFADRLPPTVRAVLPDLHAGVGIWLFVGGLLIGSVASSLSTIECYRSRYGLQWSAVSARLGSS